MLEIPLLDVDRQALTVRLGSVDVRVEVWWQPGTASWYASVEAPVGTRRVSGRRLAVDTGLLAGHGGDLAGDIYCRATGAISGDPGPRPWGQAHTHRLVWEP